MGLWNCIRCNQNEVEAYEQISINHCKNCIDEMMVADPELLQNGIIDEDIRKKLFPESVIAIVKVDLRERLYPTEPFGQKCQWYMDRVNVELAFMDMNHAWEFVQNYKFDTNKFMYKNIDAYKVKVEVNHIQKMEEHLPYATFSRLVEV